MRQSFKNDARKPSPEDLAELSRLYNHKRHIERSKEDMKAERMEFIQPLLDTMKNDIESKYGEELKKIVLRIREIKRKFRMNQEFGLYYKFPF